MSKRYIAIASICLIALLTSAIVYATFSDLKANQRISDSLLWKRPFDMYTLVYNDGKLFSLNSSQRVVCCFDASNGDLLWNETMPLGTPENVVVKEGKVFVSAINKLIICLNENNGKIQWTGETINGVEPRTRGESPGLIVKEGKVYALTGSTSAFNASTGKLLWQGSAEKVFGGITDFDKWNIPGLPLRGNSYDGDFVYATGGPVASRYYFKLDTASGKVVWQNGSWYDVAMGWMIEPSVVAITQGQVIIENCFDNDMIGLNASTGEELWHLTFGLTFYSPAVFNDVLCFGASDGNFYAFNLTNTQIAWKTNIDPENLFSYVNATNPAEAYSAIQVSSDNQRLFWGYTVSETVNSQNSTSEVFSIELSNGNLNWIKQPKSLIFGNYTNGNAYIIENSTLTVYNGLTGDLEESQSYNHVESKPILTDEYMFIKADGWLYAYQR